MTTDAELQIEVRTQLADGETLRWSGRPRQGLWIRGTDAFVIPFSLLWWGFSIFWLVMATRSGPGPFALFGVPFVIAGAYIVFGRFITDAWTRGHTIYAVTDRRVLELRPGSRRAVTSTALGQLGSIDLRMGRGGRGSILYGPAAPMGGLVPPNWPSAGVPTRLRLDGIEDAERVYRLLTAPPSTVDG